MAESRAQIRASVHASRSELIRTAQALVQAPSPNPPGDVTAAAEAAVARIQNVIPSAQITTHTTAPGITNVVAVVSSGRPGRRLVFSGHLDTFPSGDESLWTFPPLSGALSDDGKRLYGRGATDMKGGIAASILAARALVERGAGWDGDIVIALAGDEETMGQLGSAWLLQNVPAVQGADAMVCGDAGSPLVVRIGEKGLVWLEIETAGKAAHGAHVHKGDNAIELLIEALSRIKALEKMTISEQEEVGKVIAEAKAVSEPMSGVGESETLQRITVNIGTISGGVSPNLVPDMARAAADVRLPMGVTCDQFIMAAQQALEPLKGVTFRVLQKYDPSWTSPSEEIVKHSISAAREVAGPEAVVNMRVGASDSRLFRANGIPTVVVGLTPYNMGAADEYLLVEEMCMVAEIHALVAFEFLKPQ